MRSWWFIPLVFRKSLYSGVVVGAYRTCLALGMTVITLYCCCFGATHMTDVENVSAHNDCSAFSSCFRPNVETTTRKVFQKNFERRKKLKHAKKMLRDLFIYFLCFIVYRWFALISAKTDTLFPRHDGAVCEITLANREFRNKKILSQVFLNNDRFTKSVVLKTVLVKCNVICLICGVSLRTS